MSEQEPQEEGCEPARFSIKPVLIFGVGIVLALVIVYLISAWMLGAMGTPTDELRSEATPWPDDDAQRAPEQIEDWPPQLRPTPEVDYTALRERQIEKLESYGWIDREREHVRIPIDRAIDLVLEDDPVASERLGSAEEEGT